MNFPRVSRYYATGERRSGRAKCGGLWVRKVHAWGFLKSASNAQRPHPYRVVGLVRQCLMLGNVVTKAPWGPHEAFLRVTVVGSRRDSLTFK